MGFVEKKKKRKLLVLDVNGLLVDTYFHSDKHKLPPQPPDATIGNFYVYKRPFCDEFVKFCLENFVVGIWSSARRHNVENLVDYIFEGAKEQLAFIWHQAECTNTGIKHPENKNKPIFLKELSKLWEALNSSLLEAGEFGPSNTLLVDDTPYKALKNPPYTAIFPRPYTAHDLEDFSLSGALRKYLEEICTAIDVQGHVKQNPFGEPSIISGSLFWDYYKDGLKLEDHVHYDNPVHLANRIELQSENITGLSLEASQRENLDLRRLTSPVQTEVGSAAENEKVKMERCHDSKSSTGQIYEESPVRIASRDDLLNQSLERKQEITIHERNEQVRKANKQEDGKSEGIMKRKARGQQMPIEPFGLHDSLLQASSHGNAHQERNKKYRERSCGGIHDPLQNFSWQGNKSPLPESGWIVPGNPIGGSRWHTHSSNHAQNVQAHGNKINFLLQRQSSDRVLQTYLNEVTPLVSTTLDFTSNENPAKQNSHRLDSDRQRFVSGRRDSSDIPATDAKNRECGFGSTDLSHANASTRLGYADGKGRFYPSHSSGMARNRYGNQGNIEDSIHRIGRYNPIHSFSDRSSEPCHNNSGESKQSMQLRKTPMDVHNSSGISQESGHQIAYGPSEIYEQSGAYSLPFDSRVQPISDYSSSVSSLSHSYLGANEPSMYMASDAKQCLGSISNGMDDWRKGSDTEIGSSGCIHPIHQSLPFAGHFSEGVLLENGSMGHQYKEHSSRYNPRVSYSRRGYYSHVRSSDEHIYR